MPKQNFQTFHEAKLNIIANLLSSKIKSQKEEKELIFLATYRTTFKSTSRKSWDC